MSTGKTKSVPRKRAATLKPGDLAIARFGGVRPLARKLNALYATKKDHEPIHVSTITRWRYLQNGLPSARIQDLQELARIEGVRITAEELVNGGVM